MRLGISGQALGEDLSFEEIVKIGKRYGVTDYEIWPCNAGVQADYAEADLSVLKALMEREGVKIYCVTLGCAFSQVDTRDPEVYSRYLIHAIDAAKTLGASVVNHYCGTINPTEEADFQILEKYWLKPLRHAEEQNITLALENEAHDCTRTPQKMLGIIEHFHSPKFKTNFDAVNYFHASCEGFPYAYELLKAHIGYVHIKNACLQSADYDQPAYNAGEPMSGHYAPNPIQYAPIPEGAVNIPGLLTKIQEQGEYQGIVTLEPHTTVAHVEEFYAKESKWLKQLGFFKEGLL